MLNTRLANLDRFPIRLGDLMVMDIDGSALPETVLSNQLIAVYRIWFALVWVLIVFITNRYFKMVGFLKMNNGDVC